MEKDDSFWVEWYRGEFTRNMDELKHVETHEERKELVMRIEGIREHLKEKDPEFARFLDARQVNRSQRVAHLEGQATKLREETSTVSVFTSNKRVKTRKICCPECLSLDKDNKTKRLNRKQRRSKPTLKGHPVHEDAYCVSCNSRMVKMPEEERRRLLTNRTKNL